MIAMFVAIVLALAQSPSRDTSATGRGASGSGVISGDVSTSEGGAVTPLRRALVTISGTGLVGSRQAVSDDAGHFVFDGLAAGRFTITAEKPAYLKTYYGSRRPGRPPSTPIVLAERQQITDLNVAVLRGAVIDGTVRDENGRPVPSAQVTSQLVALKDGERGVTPARGTLDWAVTDDRGHYRLYGLMPGEYTVRAGGGGVIGNAHQITDAEIEAAARELRDPSVNAGAVATPNLARNSVYFPGVTDLASAQTFSLDIGEERDGVDIVNPLSAAVAGVLTDILMVAPDGTPLTNVSIGVANVPMKSTMFSPGFLRPGVDGHVVSQQLAPGTYQFYGRGAIVDAAGGALMPLWLRQEIVVDSRNMQQFVLRFSQGRTVSGQLRLTGMGSSPAVTPAAGIDTSKTRLTLAPVLTIPGSAIPTSPADVGVDGGFTFTQVPAGRYRLSVQSQAGWSPLSAKLGDRDVLDTPFEVTADEDVRGLSVALVNSLTEISGLVSDALGRPSPEYSVVVFPADKDLRGNAPRRHSGLVKIGSDGRYRVEGLPPGDYLLAVIVDADPPQLNDRVFLEQIAAGAIAIHLAEGQKLTQDLKIGG